MGAASRFLHETALKYKGDDCLIWPHKKHRLGYAQIKINNRIYTVTRIICERIYGPPPHPKYQAAHLCGNGHLGCVNPRHLQWKTGTENQADRIIHGTTNRGERNGQARLTLEQVRYIRGLRGTKTHRELARTYDVSPSTIAMVMTGRSWRHG